jgi:hypothetical protein
MPHRLEWEMGWVLVALWLARRSPSQQESSWIRLLGNWSRSSYDPHATRIPAIVNGTLEANNVNMRKQIRSVLEVSRLSHVPSGPLESAYTPARQRTIESFVHQYEFRAQ